MVDCLIIIFLRYCKQLFWLIVMNADQSWQLCIGRLFSGLTGGAFVSIQLFLADISDDRIRGRLGTFLSLYLNVGVLLGYVAGTYLPYAVIPYAMVTWPLAFIVLFAFVPSTPQYLLTVGDVKVSLWLTSNAALKCQHERPFYR